MATRFVYRYDDQQFADGHEMTSRGDHYDSLTSMEKRVETLLRKVRENGDRLRRTSLYSWEDKALAEKLWPWSRKKYLYTLEIIEPDIVHSGDVNHYTAAKNAIAIGADPTRHLALYWSGVDAEGEWTRPRRELLATKAKVVSRLG